MTKFFSMSLRKTLQILLLGSLMAYFFTAHSFKPNIKEHGHNFIVTNIAGDKFEYGGYSLPGFSTSIFGVTATFSADATEDLNKGVALPDEVIPQPFGQDLRVRSPISQNKLYCHYG